MDEKQIKELLEKQLQLLSERSSSNSSGYDNELPSLTSAMIALADFYLKAFGTSSHSDGN